MSEAPTRPRRRHDDPLARMVPPPPPAELRATVLEVARRRAAENLPAWLAGRRAAGRRAAGRRARHRRWHLAWAAGVLLLIALHLRMPGGTPGSATAGDAPAAAATWPAARVLLAEGTGARGVRFVQPGLRSGPQVPLADAWLAGDPRWRMELRKEGVL